MNKLLFTVFLFLFSFVSLQAQDLKLEFANHSGGTGIDQVFSVNIDANGNIYTVGYFEDTVDFDPRSGIHTLVSKGLNDFFVQKLDEHGNFIWAKAFGNIGYDSAWDLKLDINDNIIISGYFSDTVDFDPGSGVFNLVSKGSNDLFILKLDPLGNFIWAKSIGAQNADSGSSIDIDLNGSLYLTGIFTGTVDFDPDTSTYDLVSNRGSVDIFILKLDSNGTFVWAHGFGSTSFDEGRTIKVDLFGNIYATGFCYGGVDFDPGVGTAFLPNLGAWDIFVLKLDGDGNFIWVRGVVGPNFERGYNLALDSEFNIYTTGYFSGTVDFDTDTGTYNLSSNGSNDIFLQKLDSSGNLIWAKSMGSSGDDQGFALAIDSADNIYTSGYFNDTVNFNTDSSGTFNLISNGDEDIFIQKLDKNGNFLWAKSLGGSGWDQTRSLHIDKNDNLFATGYFETTVDFDPDTNQNQSLTSNGGKDIFILKLNQCNNSTDTIIETACSNFLSPSGKLWTQSGTYFDTIPNISGCDSLITFNLTVTNIDSTITVINNLNLFSNDTLATYQWLDCNNGFSPITGDTNRAFVATANGDYAVELKRNGCTDTSECIQVLTVGLNSTSEEQNSITLYPNPNNGSFTVSVSPDFLSKNYQIIDISGRVVKEAQFTQQELQLDLSAFGKGIYFMRVIETGWSRKIVVVE